MSKMPFIGHESCQDAAPQELWHLGPAEALARYAAFNLLEMHGLEAPVPVPGTLVAMPRLGKGLSTWRGAGAVGTLYDARRKDKVDWRRGVPCGRDFGMALADVGTGTAAEGFIAKYIRKQRQAWAQEA